MILLPALVSGFALLIAVAAGLGERRRRQRRDLDRVGFMPWGTIAFWAMAVALGAGYLAVRGLK